MDNVVYNHEIEMKLDVVTRHIVARVQGIEGRDKGKTSSGSKASIRNVVPL